MWGVDNTLLSAATDGEIFEGAPQPVDFGDVCVNYDIAWFTEHQIEPPRTLDDLLLPEYRDLLVVENPSTSSPGLAFLLSTIAEYGDDGWQQYWTDLRANGVDVADSWESAYYERFSGAGGSSGDRPLAVSYGSSPPAEVVFADPPVDTAPTGVADGTCFRQIEYAGVLRGTDHADAATKLLAFLGSAPLPAGAPAHPVRLPGIRHGGAARGVHEVRGGAQQPVLDADPTASPPTANSGRTSGTRSCCADAPAAGHGARTGRGARGGAGAVLRVAARHAVGARHRTCLGHRHAPLTGAGAGAVVHLLAGGREHRAHGGPRLRSRLRPRPLPLPRAAGGAGRGDRAVHAAHRGGGCRVPRAAPPALARHARRRGVGPRVLQRCRDGAAGGCDVGGASHRPHGRSAHTRRVARRRCCATWCSRCCGRRCGPRRRWCSCSPSPPSAWRSCSAAPRIPRWRWRSHDGRPSSATSTARPCCRCCNCWCSHWWCGGRRGGNDERGIGLHGTATARRARSARQRRFLGAVLAATLVTMLIPMSVLVARSFRLGGRWSLTAWRTLGDDQIRPGISLGVDPLGSLVTSLQYAARRHGDQRGAGHHRLARHRRRATARPVARRGADAARWAPRRSPSVSAC